MDRNQAFRGGTGGGFVGVGGWGGCKGKRKSLPSSCTRTHYHGSEKLSMAVAVSEEKSRSVPEGGADFPAAQTLAGIAFRAAGKSVKNFPAASKIAGNFSSKEFRTATAFSSSLNGAQSFRNTKVILGRHSPQGTELPQAFLLLEGGGIHSRLLHLQLQNVLLRC